LPWHITREHSKLKEHSKHSNLIYDSLHHHRYHITHSAITLQKNVHGVFFHAQTAFTVARTMFETAGLPAHLADHVKVMDEVTLVLLYNTFQNI
jgi:hypothetical protein